MSTTVDVYVPTPTARLGIDAKSAIVGRRVVPEDPESPLLVYYEGNRFNATNMVTFADRCVHAAGRMEQDYPTVAKALVRPDDVTRVATFYPEHERVEVEDASQLIALAKWLDLFDGERVDGDQLHAEMRGTRPRFVSVRELSEQEKDDNTVTGQMTDHGLSDDPAEWDA